MSTAEVSSNDVSGIASVDNADMKLEVVVIPVSDVDLAKELYASLGWRLDADRAGDDFRLIQFTPPGSGCSVQFGTSLTSAAPGSAQGLHLIVSDIEAARGKLLARGVEECTWLRVAPPLRGDGATAGSLSREGVSYIAGPGVEPHSWLSGTPAGLPIRCSILICGNSSWAGSPRMVIPNGWVKSVVEPLTSGK